MLRAPACPRPSSSAPLPITQTESTHTHGSGTALGPLSFQPVPTCGSCARPTPDLTPNLNVQLWTSGSQRPTSEVVSTRGAQAAWPEKDEGRWPRLVSEIAHSSRRLPCPTAPRSRSFTRAHLASDAQGHHLLPIPRLRSLLPRARSPAHAPVWQVLQLCTDGSQVLGGCAGASTLYRTFWLSLERCPRSSGDRFQEERPPWESLGLLF